MSRLFVISTSTERGWHPVDAARLREEPRSQATLELLLCPLFMSARRFGPRLAAVDGMPQPLAILHSGATSVQHVERGMINTGIQMIETGFIASARSPPRQALSSVRAETGTSPESNRIRIDGFH